MKTRLVINRFYAFITLACIIAISCTKKELSPEELLARGAIVVTGETSNINMHSAILYGYVDPEYLTSGQYLAIEVCNNPNMLYHIRYGYIPSLDDESRFHIEVSELSRATVFYYRTVLYKFNPEADYLPDIYIATGNLRSFKTNSFKTTVNAVDLGLSVKWNSCNLGATSPDQYGAYFAWGETRPQDAYRWINYEYLNNYSAQSKSELKDELDAAHASIGDGWRMPTDEEWTELRTQCDWEWTISDNVNGYRVTSRSNGNSIFLPAAGCNMCRFSDQGYYWSSSTDNNGRACGLSFDSKHITRNTGMYKTQGQSVRPVTD